MLRIVISLLCAASQATLYHVIVVQRQQKLFIVLFGPLTFHTPEYHWLFIGLSELHSNDDIIGGVLSKVHWDHYLLRKIVRNKNTHLFLTIFLRGRQGLDYCINSVSWPLRPQVINSNGVDIELQNISTSTPERLIVNIAELALTSGCHLGLTEHRS